MCGRFAYNAEKITPWAKDILKVTLDAPSNMDLRPTNFIACITQEHAQLQQHNLIWGIKPLWAKKLLINAQAETVVTKKTFKDSFQKRRCLVPCSGWYEWKDEGGPHKQKYYFTHAKQQPFLMAGIWYEGENNDQLVTLTTTPNEQCASIHNRMPVLIDVDCVGRWFNDTEVADLLQAINKVNIAINKC